MANTFRNGLYAIVTNHLLGQDTIWELHQHVRGIYQNVSRAYKDHEDVLFRDSEYGRQARNEFFEVPTHSAPYSA